MKFASLIKRIFASGTVEPLSSIAVLALRLVLCGAMMTHGLAKYSEFSRLWTEFPDPIGVGPGLSLLLALFAEILCSFAIGIGLLTRLSVIPLITTMCVAFFIVHGSDPFKDKELALLYLIGYVTIFLLGPGRISVDHFLSKNFDRIPWHKLFKRTPPDEKI